MAVRLAEEVFLAIGIVSAPEYVHRRAVLRHTWLSLPAPGVHTRFVVRALHAPARLHRQLSAEQRTHSDILEVSVPWNETRLRGPVLTLAAWIRHAASQLPSARYIAKVDDDSYLHAPGLAELLRSTLHPSLGAHAMAYIGTLTWYSWYAEQWDRCGFGWSWNGANAMGQFCRNHTWASQRCGAHGCGPAVGPFPFAAGYLIIVSAPLASAISSSPALDVEERRLTIARGLVTHKGFRHTQIFEDVWLGSFVHRFLPRAPVAFVQLFRSETVVDLDQTQWGSTVRPSALLVHIRSKETRIFLAVHELLQQDSSQRCRQRQRQLVCAAGCEAFGIPPEMLTSANVCLPATPPSAPAGSAGLQGMGATATVAEARSCTMRVLKPHPSDVAEGRSAAPVACSPVNLKPKVRSAASVQRAAHILEASHRIVRRGGASRRLAQAGQRRLQQLDGGDVGWRAHGSQLQAWVHVAQLRDDGSLVIPSEANVIVEIGAVKPCPAHPPEVLAIHGSPQHVRFSRRYPRCCPRLKYAQFVRPRR